MTRSGQTIGCLILALGLASVVPAGATAQMPLPSPAVRQLEELGRYAGWGAAIGTGAGVAYGLATAGDDMSRGFNAMVNGLAGFTIGLAAGVIVYIVKSVARNAAPTHSVGTGDPRVPAVPSVGRDSETGVPPAGSWAALTPSGVTARSLATTGP